MMITATSSAFSPPIKDRARSFVRVAKRASSPEHGPIGAERAPPADSRAANQVLIKWPSGLPRDRGPRVRQPSVGCSNR